LLRDLFTRDQSNTVLKEYFEAYGIADAYEDVKQF
jgi:hypothetical protein